MWRVEYTNSKGLRVYHAESFHTRKAARIWCKRVMKSNMVLHGPNGETENFHFGA